MCVAAWSAAAALSGAVGIWLAVGSVAVTLGLVVTLFDPAAALSTLRPTTDQCAIGLGVGALMSAATYWVYPLVASAVPEVATGTEVLYLAFRSPAPLVIGLALVPVVVGEELVWRGVIQRVFTERLGLWRHSRTGIAAAIVLTAATYACAHALIGSPVLIVVAFLCGLVWSTLRAFTVSLVPVLVAHLVWDALVLLWIPLV